MPTDAAHGKKVLFYVRMASGNQIFDPWIYIMCQVSRLRRVKCKSEPQSCNHNVAFPHCAPTCLCAVSTLLPPMYIQYIVRCKYLHWRHASYCSPTGMLPFCYCCLHVGVIFDFEHATESLMSISLVLSQLFIWFY